MLRRIVAGIAMTLAGAAGAGSTALAQAQTQAPAARQTPAGRQEPRKAAEHATVEGERTPGSGDMRPAGKAGVTWPGMTREGTTILPNGWSLKPAGRQSKLGDLPVQMALHPSQPILAVLHAGYGEHEIVTVDLAANGRDAGRVIGRVALPGTFAGLVWSPDGKQLYAGGGFDDVVYRFDHADGLLSSKTVFRYPNGVAGRARKSQRTVAGLAISSDGKTLHVAAAFGHSVGRFDAQTGEFQGEVRLEDGSYPFGLALDESRGRLYVSLWGHAGVAAIDLKTDQVVATWPTQEHPSEILAARGGTLLYVANANRNTVTVIDAEAGKPIETIGTAIDPKAPSGSTPSSLALSPDESMLFVANANTNNLAVINVTEPGASAPLGFIPVGWYPTSVRVARDGKTLYVANGKGSSSRANRDGPRPGFPNAGGPTIEYVGRLFPGTLSTIPMPDSRRMAAYSQTVYQCSPLRRGDPLAVRGAPPAPGNPIPAKLGDPSPIKHVVYVIKENRTYDQVFGDMPQGNGDPNICLFPEAVTPNHHALVREFVLLDNFYVDSEVSADGHEWSMGAYASDFVERMWPIGYRGDRRVPYPSEGNVFEMAKSSGGYLWDKAIEKGVSYRTYGEFVNNAIHPGLPATTSVKALEGRFDPLYRGFDMDYPDVKRVDRFLEELAGFEKTGEMPGLTVVKLPNDHTSGTTPGKWTVTACVGDNDLALGRLVEGLSKSRFWKEMAIFVVEDDAQNGSDHVDAHRTVALAISPYIKKHSVDSTLYSTSSMLRTMELILGLAPMSQFDASARPMYASFTAAPDFTPFVHRPANVDLDARNGRDAPLADASRKLDLEIEDRNDDLLFNEIIWKAVKGKDSPMPPPVRAAFVLPRKDDARSKD
ncbi:MAG: bifunctional YncE family protein/alkaline phosphatase family protein [Isosphaeraceae bacterium]